MTASDRPRAAIYLRMSLDRELGIDRQREDCWALCERLGWDGIEYVDNDRSATKANVIRPAYELMCKDIRAGNIDAIITWRSDRLYRTLRDLLPFIDLIMNSKKRIPIETCQTGLIDLTTDSGRMTAKILAAVSENEGEVRTARQMRALEQIARSGRGWGVRAFGYNGDHDNPQLVPEEADAVRQAYADVLAGASLYSIARKWNAEGLKTPRTNGAPWNGTSLRRLLINPRYAGLRSFRGEIIGDGDWPPIVSRDTWEAVCYLLADPKRRKSQSTVRTQLLGGILCCGTCGSGLVSGKQSRTGTPIYRCRNYETCKAGVGRRRDWIDEWVREIVIKKLQKGAWADAAQLNREDAQALHEEAEQIRLRMDSLANDFAEGDLTPSQLRVANEKLQQKLSVIEHKLSRAARSHVFDAVLGATDIGKAYDDLPLDRKRALIEAMIDRIEVHPLGTKGRAAAKVPIGTNIKVYWHKPSDS
jgi:DNA invertase Pin-like site-specific DNA recombinase